MLQERWKEVSVLCMLAGMVIVSIAEIFGFIAWCMKWDAVWFIVLEHCRYI